MADWLLRAALDRRESDRGGAALELDPDDVDAPAPGCSICGRKLQKGRNKSGVCAACQRAQLSPAVCACGCGRHLRKGALGRYTRACATRLLSKAK